MYCFTRSRLLVSVSFHIWELLICAPVALHLKLIPPVNPVHESAGEPKSLRALLHLELCAIALSQLTMFKTKPTLDGP
jgi:hypothetical protein